MPTPIADVTICYGLWAGMPLARHGQVRGVAVFQDQRTFNLCGKLEKHCHHLQPQRQIYCNLKYAVLKFSRLVIKT